MRRKQTTTSALQRSITGEGVGGGSHLLSLQSPSLVVTSPSRRAASMNVDSCCCVRSYPCASFSNDCMRSRGIWPKLVSIPSTNWRQMGRSVRTRPYSRGGDGPSSKLAFVPPVAVRRRRLGGVPHPSQRLRRAFGQRRPCSFRICIGASRHIPGISALVAAVASSASSRRRKECSASSLRTPRLTQVAMPLRVAERSRSPNFALSSSTLHTSFFFGTFVQQQQERAVG